MDAKISLPHMLNELERLRFYGSVEILYQSGRVTLIRKTETIRPADDRSTFEHRDNRSNHNGSQ